MHATPSTSRSTSTDNQFTNMGTGVENTLFPDGDGAPSSFAFNAMGNTFSDLDSGISTFVEVTGDQVYNHTEYVGNNVFYNNEYDDYELELVGFGDSATVNLNVEVSHNRSTDGDTFVDIELGDNDDGDSDPISNGQFNIEIADNEVLDVDEGIVIGGQRGPDVNLTILRNQLRNVDDGEAIDIDIENSGYENGHSVTIADNLIEDVSDNDGIEVDVVDSDDLQLTVANNVLRDIYDTGIEIDVNGVGNDGNSVTVSGNLVEFVEDGNGIDVAVNDSADSTITIADNTVQHVESGHGIELDLENTGFDLGNTVTISGNTIREIDGTGIDIYFQSLTDELGIHDADDRRQRARGHPRN